MFNKMTDEYEDSIRCAVFSKVKKVNHLINEITIGPHSLRNLSVTRSPNTSSPKVSLQPRNERKEVSPSSGLPTRHILKLLDLERQENVQSALNERLNRFEQFNRAQAEQSKQSWLRTQQTFIEDMEKQEMYIIEANQQYDLKQSTQHAKMAQLTQNAIQRMKERQEILKEKERQTQILAEHINKIKSNQQKFSSEFQQILSLLKGCADNAELKDSKELDFNLLRTLPAEIETVLEKCKGDNVATINDKDVQTSDEVVLKIIDFKNKFKAAVDSINNKRQEIAKAAEESIKQEQHVKTVQPTTPQAVFTTPVVTSSEVVEQNTDQISSDPDIAVGRDKLRQYVNLNDLQTYTELISFQEQYRKNFSHLENDQSLKTFRFDCKKAINIPVNALSGVNSEHITDKYRKLFRLLTGQSVIVSDKEVIASQHPQGITFCMDLLAKKFVLQGDLMVSGNPESAFCYASVILSLWNDFPDFGRLLLAYFYKMCPYLVPYYIPKQVGESDEEFYMKLGYQYSDGEVEKQDKYLKRMTGIMKLYFAITITKPKRGQNSSPHNLRNAWKWLASFLRLEPQLDVTATALHVFLETVGFEMEAKYGKMFQKLLTMIIQVFLPKCKEVKCTGGAVVRLELLLTDYLKNRRFEKPNGYVEYAYW